MIKQKKGFTLIELLVVVLIIGILAAMAMPQYFKAVERSRMSEAVSLISSLVQAQRRKYIQTNKYATDFKGLDVSPKDSSGMMYFTKGNPQTGENGNGFMIMLSPTGIEALRFASSGSLQYQYVLRRVYSQENITCTGGNDAGKELCADFCGIDAPVTGNVFACCSNGTEGECTD